MSAERNTKYVQIPFEVPRDPGEYAPTDHFRQRLNGRTNPELKPWIVKECIEEGTLRGEPDTKEYSEDDVHQFYAFMKEVWSEGTHHWTVIVGIVPAAFKRDGVNHRVITAYCPCHSNDPTEGCA